MRDFVIILVQALHLKYLCKINRYFDGVRPWWEDVLERCELAVSIFAAQWDNSDVNILSSSSSRLTPFQLLNTMWAGKTPYDWSTLEFMIDGRYIRHSVPVFLSKITSRRWHQSSLLERSKVRLQFIVQLRSVIRLYLSPMNILWQRMRCWVRSRASSSIQFTNREMHSIITK